MTGYREARGNWIAHVYSLNGGANKTAIYCTAACSEGPVHTTPLSAKQLPKNTAILPTHALPLISPVSSPFREAKSLHCIPHGNGLSSMVRRNWEAKDPTSIERERDEFLHVQDRSPLSTFSLHTDHEVHHTCSKCFNYFNTQLSLPSACECFCAQ